MEYILPHSILPRVAEPALVRALRTSAIVVLLGSRQTGKTTLLRSMQQLAGRPCLTFDDFDLRARAESDPDSIVLSAPSLVLEEVQRAPRELFVAVKRVVDRDPSPVQGRFVLTCSADIRMMERLSEVFSKRATYVPLRPFARWERSGLGRTGCWSELLAEPMDRWRDVLESSVGTREDWHDATRHGGMSLSSRKLTDDAARTEWFTNFTQAYLERDVPALRAVEDLPAFRRLMRAACQRLGGMLNQTELGREAGISQPQVHRFMNLLETSFQAVRLQPFALNRARRIIKTPKLYWSDSALALHLAGETEPREAHLENLALADLLAWRDVQTRKAEVLYWRTTTGIEVDFVIETSDRVLPIEVRTGMRVARSDARGIESFLDEYPDLADGGLLLHTGEDTFQLTSSVLAVPWWRVC